MGEEENGDSSEAEKSVHHLAKERRRRRGETLLFHCQLCRLGRRRRPSFLPLLNVPLLEKRENTFHKKIRRGGGKGEKASSPFFPVARNLGRGKGEWRGMEVRRVKRMFRPFHHCQNGM